jgi:hypothetical protein
MAGSPPQDFTDISRSRVALLHLHSRLSAFVNAQGILPHAHSPALLEETTFLHPESVRTVVSQANQLIEVAGDHLTAFVKTISDPLETIAPWTCVRAILESAAVAAWLLDPAIEAKTRVGRSLALRFEGMEQQLRYCRLKDVRVTREVAERIREVESEAASWGFAPRTDRNGKRLGIGQRMPSATELIRTALDEEGMYRLLSGVAHAHFWAVHALGFRPAEGLSSPLPPGYRAAEKSVNVQGMLALAALVAGAIGRVAWRQCSYYGWSHDELRSFLEPMLDMLRVPDRKRPW